MSTRHERLGDNLTALLSRVGQSASGNHEILRDKDAVLSGCIGMERHTNADVREIRVEEIHSMPRAT